MCEIEMKRLVEILTGSRYHLHDAVKTGHCNRYKRNTGIASPLKATYFAWYPCMLSSCMQHGIQKNKSENFHKQYRVANININLPMLNLLRR